MRQFVIFVLVGGLFLIGCERSPTLVKVGNKRITEADLNVLGEINPRLKPRLATPQGRKGILDNYVEQTLLYKAAKERGLHRTPETKTKLELYEKIIIAQSVLDDELEKKIKEYYENHRDEFERVSLAHILIRTVEEKDPKGTKKPKTLRSEEAARALALKTKGRLEKGDDFAKVAEEVSDDKRTKKSGGTLGFLTIRDKRLERWGWLALSEKGFAMKKGEISDPIKTEDGFHVVRVIEEKSLQPFSEAEAGVRFRIQSDVRQELLARLKEEYKVEYVEPARKAAQKPATEPTTPAAPPAEAEPSPQS